MQRKLGPGAGQSRAASMPDQVYLSTCFDGDDAMRSFRLLPLLLVLGGCVTAPPAPSLYERVGARLAARTDLAALSQPPPQLAQVIWLLGHWTVDVTVFATATTPQRNERGSSTVTPALGGTWLQIADTYPHGTQDLSLLTYNQIDRHWVSTGIDGAGNAVTSTGTWHGDSLVFETGIVHIMGEALTLRQIFTRQGTDEYTVRNEELLHGGWRALDEYHYRRAQ
jgi:hypothetical protein